MKKTYEDYKKENIEITFEGKQYALLEDAEMYTYESNGWEIVRYTAQAIDKEGILYSVTWEITDEFERQLEEQELQYVDEQDACDWENPITVEKIQIW